MSILKYEPISKEKLKTVSLFSGCGGMDLGLKMADFDLVWANDIVDQVCKTYKYNIGNNIINKDITEIDISEIPDCDAVVAGFPCQPFSTAGKREGLDDSRGNLFKEFLRVINAKKPMVFILENVRGILSTKNPDGTKFVNTLIEYMENVEPGYDVNHKLLLASEYGVPQNRYRVFFVGIRKDLNLKYVFPKKTHSKDAEQHKLKNTLIDINKDIPNQDEVWELSPQAKKMVKYITEGGSWKDIPYDHLPKRFKKIRDNMKKYRSPNFYRRYSREEINGTITAAATPENCGIIHPIKDRRYSVREIARIQSFPDDFIFVGDSIRAKYKMIGNAVPPKLSQALGTSIIQTLNQIDEINFENDNQISQQLVMNL